MSTLEIASGFSPCAETSFVNVWIEDCHCGLDEGVQRGRQRKCVSMGLLGGLWCMVVVSGWLAWIVSS